MKQSPEINISKVSQPMVDVPLRIHKVMVDLVHLYAARKKLSMSFCILYRATLIVARAHILSRPRVMCSQVRML